MFDIFAEEQPSLYIADVKVKAYMPERKGSKNIRRVVIDMGRVPIILLNGDFPTKNTRNSFMRRVFDNHISRGDFSKIRFEVESISNVKFSSKLAWKFDFSVH
jgi:hypothetical protein